MNRNDDLSSLLRGWQSIPSPAPGFNREVWARIAEGETRRHSPWESLAEWMNQFARPRIAVAAAMLALFAGTFAGSLQARTTGEERYLRSLNPYQLHSTAR